ncbi:GxxExxY protein [Coraliomargarita sinensis]|uniref:GxxExxY protein n=1 Tax=Coraliomargarita sinensis TaxID=2174842 RepID=A0A317ZIV1_9BACT|nr:GxxExxY protein [Coraliomargarita sinensis]PXA05506.1 GxxExxY protein [Coraliomargarita sinensis]
MDEYTELTGIIVGAAMEVHSHWGPGLIESIYEKSLAHELKLRGIEVRRQVKLQLKYKDLELDEDFTLDLIADGKVIVELKVVKELAAIHQAQLITYMKRTDCKVGLLINFNVVILKRVFGVSRFPSKQLPSSPL